MHHTHTLKYENKLTHYIHALHFINRDIMSELIVAGFGHHHAYPSPPKKDIAPFLFFFGRVILVVFVACQRASMHAHGRMV
jgi:hypothetical protein